MIYRQQRKLNDVEMKNFEGENFPDVQLVSFC